LSPNEVRDCTIAPQIDGPIEFFGIATDHLGYEIAAENWSMRSRRRE
jgi:hypothetical protein